MQYIIRLDSIRLTVAFISNPIIRMMILAAKNTHFYFSNESSHSLFKVI